MYSCVLQTSNFLCANVFLAFTISLKYCSTVTSSKVNSESYSNIFANISYFKLIGKSSLLKPRILFIFFIPSFSKLAIWSSTFSVNSCFFVFMYSNSMFEISCFCTDVSLSNLYKIYDCTVKSFSEVWSIR